MENSKKRAFIDLAVVSQCRAFSSFVDSAAEFHPDLSSSKTHPDYKVEGPLSEYIQGTFLFTRDSVSDLYFVCEYLHSENHEYFVFWQEASYTIQGNPKTYYYEQYVIWLPNHWYCDGY